MQRALLILCIFIASSNNAFGWEHGSCSNSSVVLLSTTNTFGTYNLDDGSKGPFWSGQGIWNPVTRTYTGIKFTSGSTSATGFSSTTGLWANMLVHSDPIVTPPGTTVASFGANSVIMSQAATGDSTNNSVVFGLQSDGSMYFQTITDDPCTFPSGTVMNWSYPSERNDAAVYAYPEISYGVGGGGYYNPTNRPPAMKANSFTKLAVTYDVTTNYGADDADCLIETWLTTVPNPKRPDVNSSLMNEVGFLCHTPSYMATYILSLANHFNYSSGGFNAYIATTRGTALTRHPPFIMVMPVTEPNGTTPLNMTSGRNTMPIEGVIDELIAKGTISGDSYITGFEFGFEIGRNSGSVTINNIAWTWN